MQKDITTWANSIIESVNRPKFTQYNMEKRKIIGLHGKLQSGKDTSAQFLLDRGFKRLAFADALRTQLYKANPIIACGLDYSLLRVKDIVDEKGWDYAKTQYPEVRRLLQILGTEGNREIHGQDCWVNVIKRQVDAEPLQSFVLTDLRFPNELEMVKFLGGTTIRVTRDNANVSKEFDNHASEQILENCDYTIENNGSLEDLRYKILDIAGLLLHKEDILC